MNDVRSAYGTGTTSDDVKFLGEKSVGVYFVKLACEEPDKARLVLVYFFYLRIINSIIFDS